MKKFLSYLTAISIALLAGCAHGQPSPSPSPVVGWTWALAQGNQSSWVTTLYTATVPSLTSQCPIPGGSAYKAVGTTAGNVGSFSDPNETPGTFICSLTQNSSTCGGVPCYSPYSPVSSPFAIPALPTVPGLPVPTVTTAMLAPSILKPETTHAPTVAVNTPPRPGAPKLSILRSGL